MQVFSKKSLLAQKSQISRNLQKKGLCAENRKFSVKFQTKKKKVMALDHFSQIKKSAVLGRGQGIFEDLEAWLRGQVLQNMSSRTPPL